MKKWTILSIVFVALVCMAALTSGCETDEFADAPTARASADGEHAYGGEGQERRGTEGLGPVEGTELPPGHPPVGGQQQGGQQQGGQGGGQMPAAPQIERISPSEYGEAGPIRWQTPSTWNAEQPQSDMRFAQYGVGGASEGESAEVVVFFFGPQGGGGVEANLQRWAGQLTGGPEAVRGERDIDGMTVHTLDVAGTYQTDMAMGGSNAPVEDQRMLAAIAETSEGLFFFRLLGDRTVVDAEAESFDAFVGTFHEG